MKGLIGADGIAVLGLFQNTGLIRTTTDFGSPEIR